MFDSDRLTLNISIQSRRRRRLLFFFFSALDTILIFLSVFSDFGFPR